MKWKRHCIRSEKATEYKISHSNFGSTVGKTSLVDAADIAKQFEEKGAGDTNSNNATDSTEKRKTPTWKSQWMITETTR